jgi:hypothetical protein
LLQPGAKALRPLTPELDVAAKDVIDDLLSRDSFNGVTDFASRLPISVVSDMVGVHVPPTCSYAGVAWRSTATGR